MIERALSSVTSASSLVAEGTPVGEAHRELPMPAELYGIIAFLLFLLALAVLWSFRNTAAKISSSAGNSPQMPAKHGLAARGEHGHDAIARGATAAGHERAGARHEHTVADQARGEHHDTAAAERRPGASGGGSSRATH